MSSETILTRTEATHPQTTIYTPVYDQQNKMLVTHKTPMLHLHDQFPFIILSNPPHSSLSSSTSILSRRHKQIERQWLRSRLHLNTRKSSLQVCKYSSPQEQQTFPLEEEDNILGDSIVFEEGIFENPFIPSDAIADANATDFVNKQRGSEAEDEDSNSLIPEGWRDVQRELNLTKKEKKKRTQRMELENSFGKKKETQLYKDSLSEFNTIKLPQLKFPTSDSNGTLNERAETLPAVPSGSTEHKEDKLGEEIILTENSHVKDAQIDDSVVRDEQDEVTSVGDGLTENSSVREEVAPETSSDKRVLPKNPRPALVGASLEDVAKSFEQYRVGEKGKGRPPERLKLFTAEEKILLNKRVPDLQQATSTKWIPLHTLATAGQSYLLDLLLTHNVDINAIDKDGLTALHKAVSCKKDGIVSYLLKAGADASIRDRDGATLMHYAVQVAAIQTIKLLILYHVDINFPDNYGWTPLHLAVQSRRTDVVRLMLLKGADKSIQNKDGYTPLDLCLCSGRDTRTYELIRLLKKLSEYKLQNGNKMQLLKLRKGSSS